jgi:nitric-oxide synthase, bacterial
MANQSGCPFLATRSIGESATKTRDRAGGGTASSTWAEARDYLTLFHREREIPDLLSDRLRVVRREIDTTGTYWHTPDELAHGARVAWRNSNRCIGRLFWESLQLRDMRHLTTEEEMFASCVDHLGEAYNGGKIRAVITVFPAATPGSEGIRFWNPQLIRYAGYRQADGSVTGDPLNCEFTDAVRALGWRGGEGTPFDVLPLVIQIPGRSPRLFVRDGENPRRVIGVSSFFEEN